MSGCDSLVADLADVVDDVRQIHADLGTRPWRVRVVKIRWSGRRRGDGDFSVTSVLELSPLPFVEGLAAKLKALAAGLNPEGDYVISEISLRYTKEQLHPTCSKTEEFYWEVIQDGLEPERCFPSSDPERQIEKGPFGWKIILTLQDGVQAEID